MPGVPPSPPPRCSTGITGLDDALGGGLPKDRFYLIQGDPGVGKTTLALNFLLEGASRGESALYITLSETREELQAVAGSHGWDLSRLTLLDLIADSVMILRYFEAMAEVRRAMSMMKKRSGSHEHTIREYQIASQGITVGEPLEDFHGVLTGTPSFHGGREDMMAEPGRSNAR